MSALLTSGAHLACFFRVREVEIGRRFGLGRQKFADSVGVNCKKDADCVSREEF